LKRDGAGWDLEWDDVAPFTGAWIETHHSPNPIG